MNHAIRTLIAAAFSLLAGAAHAQGTFPDASNTAVQHPGIVQMGVNAAGQATPLAAQSSGVAGVPAGTANIPVNSYNYCWNGITYDPCGIILTGTFGAPATTVLSVQGPASNGTFPTAALPIGGNGSGTTGAVVGTLAGASARTTYLCEFDVSAIGGTAAVGPIVVAGSLGGSRTYQLTASATGVFLSKSFNPCIPASAANTPITITTTADGTATAVNVNSSGYQQ